MLAREATMSRMERWRHTHRQEVAFRDLDALGHVNNAVYLTYLENARFAYFRDVLAVESLDEVLAIVAAVKIDFRSRASLGETLEISSRVSRVGAKSFDVEHQVRGSDGRLVAEAAATLVAFDYTADVTVTVPEEWRDRIEEFEARSFAAA
jgi:acyl-CoA thioester hydrolase